MLRATSTNKKKKKNKKLLKALPLLFVLVWPHTAKAINDDVAQAINNYAAQNPTTYGVDTKSLLTGLAMAESNGNNGIVSKDGGYGWAQITGSTIAACGTTGQALLNDPAVGVNCAVKVLAEKAATCQAKAGNNAVSLSAVLCAYNAGSSGCDSSGQAVGAIGGENNGCYHEGHVVPYFQEVLNNANLASVGQNLTTLDGSGSQAYEFNCPSIKTKTEKEYEQSFNYGMNGGSSTGSTSFYSYLNNSMNNGAQEGIKAVRSVMDTAQPSNIKQFYCIGNELQLLNFSNLGAMLLGAMQTVIDSIVSQIETAACQYVQATVNNVLVKLCLPMPQIGMIDLGLSAPAMKSCNGIQLAKVPNGVQPYLEKNVDVYFKNAADTLGLSGAKAANTYNSTPILK